ncbi:MAG TPA: molecular chaperone DnaJ [Caulobacteraceae bacterium]|jgi:curved DNA-binding protein|nr:molecular chaperone DnaJ [Caulobacteraceae bacterium]
MSGREALAVLGLAAADPRQLRKAYLAAVKAVHPDKPGGDAERLRRVIEAYEVLLARPSPAACPPPRPASRQLEITPAEAMLGGAVSVPLQGGGAMSLQIPPGLRVGDLVAVSGGALTVSIIAADGLAIVGNHLCLTLKVEKSILSAGGDVQARTPRGPLNLNISPQDGARGLVHVAGGGLPERGHHPRGDLLVKLEALAAPVFESKARVLLRRFAASWAA